MAVAVPGAVVQFKKGVEGRLSAMAEIAAAEARNKNPRQEVCFLEEGVASPSCIFGGTKPRVVLIGDSHADALATALTAAVPIKTDGVVFLGYSGCPTIFDVKYLSPDFGAKRRCSEFMNWAEKKLSSYPLEVPAVIVNRTSIYAIGFNDHGSKDPKSSIVFFNESLRAADKAEFAHRLTHAACRLARERTVYLVRPIPEMEVNVPTVVSRGLSFGRHRNVSISLVDYHQRHAFVWAAQDAARERCGVKILDPLPYLCSDGRCHGVKDGRPLYYDDDHLSEHGNKLLVPMFAKVFE